MPNLQLIWLIGWGFTLVVCGLALWKGGAAERVGGGFFLAVAFVTEATRVLPTESRQLFFLVSDFVTAVGFLAIAIRYASLWLGGAMVLLAIQFSLHAYYFVTETPRNYLFSIINNINFFLVLGCILAGVLARMWRSTHARRRTAIGQT